MRREVSVSLEDFALAREFVKRELKKKGEVSIEDLKEVAPESFKDPDLLTLFLTHLVSEVLEGVAEYIEFDDKQGRFRVISEAEYDPENPRHMTPEELEEVVNSLLKEE